MRHVALSIMEEEAAMRIPEHLRAPAIVFGLQFALLAGCGLVFLLLAQR